MYDGTVKNLVLRFKKNDEIYLKKIFTEWLLNVSQSWINRFDIIVPIPFHPIKMILRTHNQSLTVAQDYAHQLKTKLSWKGQIIPDLLRSRKISSIHHLSSYDRFKAVSGAFSIKDEMAKRIRGKNILIIDDVMTTGSTISEAAHILKRNEAVKVYGLTIARTLKRRNDSDSNNFAS